MGRNTHSGTDCPFPVGMWCFYDGSESPSVFWPGTSWAKMEGRFLFGSGSGRSVGATGGEESHKLTEAELPVIDGTFATAVLPNHANTGVYGHAYGANMNGITPSGSKRAWTNTTTTDQYGYGYKFGGDQPHNNMPPFYVTNMWRRTA